MWNSLDLKCPNDDLPEYLPQDQYLTESLRDFVTVLSAAADTLTSENPLWSELQVLQKIQLKYKRTLRCDRCLAFIHRVGTCIKRMVLLNLSKSYLDLAEKFLVGMQDSSLTCRLPSRQQLEYVLFRTVTASKLVCQSIEYTRKTFCYLIQRLKIGHLILDLVMAASVTARLNILLRGTIKQLCSMYEQILSWRYKLKAGTFQWAQKPDFPQDLGAWLKISQPECLEPFPASKLEIEVLDNLLKPSDSTNDDDDDAESKDSDAESIILVEEVVSGVKGSLAKRNAVDYGEVVPRKKSKVSLQLQPEQKLLLHRILQVQSLKGIEKLWKEIGNFPSNHFPKVLTDLKKRNVEKLFTQIKKTVSEKKYNKMFKNEPALLKTAHSVFCKHLGFSEADIELCRTELRISRTPDVLNTSHSSGVSKTPPGGSSSEMPLVPVRTLKKLRILYSRLCEVLKFSEEPRKLRKLQKYFKERKADIKLLKQKGEKKDVTRLVFCTSKLLLTWCQL